MATNVNAFTFPSGYTQTAFHQRAQGTSNESTYDGPFALRVRDGFYRVLSTGSTITDGTNGSSIDLSAVLDVEVAIGGTRFIAIESDVDASLALVAPWRLLSVATSAEVEEVGIDITDPADPFQDKIRLYIGKITVSRGSFTVYQACHSAQRLTHGLFNGLAVKVFESCSVHPDHT